MYILSAIICIYFVYIYDIPEHALAQVQIISHR